MGSLLAQSGQSVSYVVTGDVLKFSRKNRLHINSYIGIFRYMNIEKALAAINNPVRRQILNWLKDRSNFPPALPDHAEMEGVCVTYIQEKAKLSQSTISNYMSLLKGAGLVVSERHGQFTFYRRNEDVIGQFLDAVEHELLKP